MGPGPDGPMGGMGSMEPHHMNGSLGEILCAFLWNLECSSFYSTFDSTAFDSVVVALIPPAEVHQFMIKAL